MPCGENSHGIHLDNHFFMDEQNQYELLNDLI